jgi:hypothetical protein
MIPKTADLKKQAEEYARSHPKHPGGRPPKPKYRLSFMIKKIAEYTEREMLPILKECCFENNWNYDYVMELERKNTQLSQSIKRLLAKKEVMLEKMLYSGENNTGYIFSLKQLGWRDRFDQEISGGLQLVRVTDSEAAGLE